MMGLLCIATLVFFFSFTTSNACTIIAAGKKATVDGSTFMAHTDDAGFSAADVRLVRVPAQDHALGSMRPVYNFAGGYPRIVSKERGFHYMPKDDTQTLTTPLGYIPQVPHTYAYFDQDYGMMNEVQLSIAESTCGAKTVGWAKDVPYGKNLFGIAELSKVALERCDSARCAIQTMGDLAVEYGFYSEDSGNPNAPDYGDSAEALGIADKYGEVWIFHVLTGKNNASAVWAAQRVQEEHVTVVANGFTIREMDLEDKENFMASSNVISFAQEMGWYRSDMKFDFTSAYGSHDKAVIGPLYIGRRIWRVFDVLAPSLQLDSTLGSFAQYPTYPFSIKPDQQVDINTIMELMRDHFEGTSYDMTKGLGAGPFGNPVRWDGPFNGVHGGWERSISMYRTMFSFVLQARSHLPDEIGGVVWYAQDAPHGSVYVPFACTQEDIPVSYLLGKQSEFHPQSAWWAFNFVNNWSNLRFNAINQDVRKEMSILQHQAFVLRQEIENTSIASSTTNNTSTSMFIQAKSNAFAQFVVDHWWQLAWKLVAKYSDGFITTGEGPNEMQTIGYPAFWLQATEFSSWPGKTFSPPKDDSVKKELFSIDMYSSSSSKFNTGSTHNFMSKGMFVGWIWICLAFICIGWLLFFFIQKQTNKKFLGYQTIA
jgi:dipeptidase